MKNQLVTIYTDSEFTGNIVKYEGKLIGFGTKKYAQYNNAPFVDFIPKYKRKGFRLTKPDSPYLLVISGVGHLDPDETFVSHNNPSILKNRYLSFDVNWITDFENKLDTYLSINKPEILLDARSTKGFSSY